MFQKTDQGIKDLVLLNADLFLIQLNRKFGTVHLLEEFEKEYEEFNGGNKEDLWKYV